MADLRRHVSEAAIAPDLVLCSSARRAVETWEGIAPACPPDTPVEVTGELYGATAGDLLRRLRRLPVAVEQVILVGHNPGLEDLANGLVGSGEVELMRRLDAKFPTGALATLDLPEPWAKLRWGGAALTSYVVPRQLRSA